MLTGAFFLGKIPSYSAPALALLNGFEPCPSQNPGYATGDDMVCADFVLDVRLGRISFNSREDTSMIINSICCD